MDRYDDERGDIRLSQVVMAAADMCQGVPLALKSHDELSAAHLRGARQPTATSRSTNSAGSGRGMPSFSAASR
jgi:hypothetical protein